MFSFSGFIMDFNFSINETFPGKKTIIKIGHDLLPEDCNTFNGRNFHLLQQRVNEILDSMGNASARAQSLKASITSGSRYDYTVWSSDLYTLLMRYEVNLTPCRIKSVYKSLDQTVYRAWKSIHATSTNKRHWRTLPTSKRVQNIFPMQSFM